MVAVLALTQSALASLIFPGRGGGLSAKSIESSVLLSKF
jgi:hypothetical protein